MTEQQSSTEVAHRHPTEMILEFYKKLKEPIPADGPATLDPAVIPEERLHLKLALIAEEFSELIDAVYGEAAGEVLREAFIQARSLDNGRRDVVLMADALGDMTVVEQGLVIEARVPYAKVLDEIHASNLSKLGADGEPIRSDGTDGNPVNKVLKGPDFFDPDLEAVIEEREPDHTPRRLKS